MAFRRATDSGERAADTDRNAIARRVDVPTLMAGLVLLLGLASILSALSPRLHQQLEVLLEWMPDHGPTAANAVTLASGAVLLVLAPALRRRKQRAWLAATALSALAVATHLLARLDLEDALLSAAVLVFLLLTRSQFTAEPDPRSRRRTLWVVLVGVPAAVLGGWVLLTLHADSQAAGTTWWDRVQEAALGLVGVDGPVRYLSSDAYWAAGTALATLGIALLVVVLAVAVSSYRPVRLRSRGDERALRELISQYGSEDSLSYFGLRDDRAASFAADAAVTYRTVGGVAIAAGDPVGDQAAWDDTVRAWLAHVRRSGWTPAVVGASQFGAATYRRAGLRVLPLGDEATLAADTFGLDGRAMRTVRQAVARVERAGYRIDVDRVRDLSTTDLAVARAAAEQWRHGSVERGYSMALGRMGSATDGECVLVRAFDATDRLQALTYWVPWGEDGVSLDLMRRAPDAANGVVEAMIVTLLRGTPRVRLRQLSLNFVAVRTWFDLGRADDAPLPARLFHRTFVSAMSKWQVDSLYRSCAKYHPTWVTRYLCYPSGLELPRILLAVLRAESFLTRPRLARPPHSQVDRVSGHRAVHHRRDRATSRTA